MPRSKKNRKSRRVINSIKRRKTVKRRKMVKRCKIITTHNKYIGGANNSDIFDPEEAYDNAIMARIADKSECSVEAINLNKGFKPINLNTKLPSNFKLEQSGAGVSQPSTRYLPSSFIKQNQQGGGRFVDTMSDITQSLVNEFKRANNFSDSETKSLSIFNPSLTWLRDDGQVSYYCCTSRCCISIDSTTNRPVTEEFINRSYASMKRRMDFFNIRYNNPDKNDDYVKSSGSIFNKWFTPWGFWRPPLGTIPADVTMITMIRVDWRYPSAAPFFGNSQILGSTCGDESSPIDARVLNMFTDYVSTDAPTSTIDTVYITGSRNGPCIHPDEQSVGPELTPNHVFPIDPESSIEGSPAFNGPMIDGGAWKQSLTRVQILKRGDQICYSFPYQTDITGRDPFTKREKSRESALANCISWYQKTEKNYALFYFDNEDPDRTFCPEKCMILNYSMTSRPSNIRDDGGVVFYYKPFDSRVDDPSNFNSLLDGKQFEEGDFELDGYDDTWKTIQPTYSDVFNKINAYFAHCDLRVSCTTPFVKWDNSLIAVGHIKVNIFKHLNEKLKEKYHSGMTDFDEIVNFYTNEEVDRLFAFGIDMIRRITQNIMNHPIHGYNGDMKYLVRFNQRDNEVVSKEEKYLIYQFLTPGYEAVRALLISEGFIILDESGKYITTRNLHPIHIYFMFFYKINAHTLSLESFSDPFILGDGGDESFLNFPLGITQCRPLTAAIAGQKSLVWVSYGEGDCRCKIASFTPDQIDTLVAKNNNNTKVQNINFSGYSA
jgi:hypothetical protein